MNTWKQLTIEDLRKILSEDEVQSLENMSKIISLDRIQSTLDLIADTWRGAISAKGYSVYERAHWVPNELAYWILVHARWAIWTTFPMSPSIALDEARKSEYEQALKYLEKMPFAIKEPVYSEDPELSGSVKAHELGDSIFVPRMRLDTYRNYLENIWPFPI